RTLEVNHLGLQDINLLGQSHVVPLTVGRSGRAFHRPGAPAAPQPTSPARTTVNPTRQEYAAVWGQSMIALCSPREPCSPDQREPLLVTALSTVPVLLIHATSERPPKPPPLRHGLPQADCTA